jgi:hypothetical protein
MAQSEILQREHRDMIRRCQRMKPEERLVAYVRHSQLMHEVYQAGVRHRMLLKEPQP